MRNSTLPAFTSCTALPTSKVTVPVFGFGIRPLGTEHLSQTSDGLHHVGRGDQGVEICPVFLGDLLDHLFAADEIRARRFGFAFFFAGGDDQNFFRLAQPVRQNHGAADHLVRVLGIDSQAQRDFNGFIELGKLYFLQKRDRFLQRVGTRLRLPPAPW